MTLNVRCLRKPHKVEALKHTMRYLDVDVAIITESQPSEAETKRLVLPGFAVEAKDCRVGVASGGVFPAVRTPISYSAVDKPVEIKQPANVCSVFKRRNADDGWEIRLTSLYLPSPTTAHVAPECVSPHVDTMNQSSYEDGWLVCHILVGDFFRRSWKGDGEAAYQEWVLDHGLLGLSNPGRATHKQGPALDRCLLLPGCDVPGAFFSPPLPQERDDEQNYTGDFCFARTLPFKCGADHHPLLPEIPTAKTHRPAPRWPPKPRSLSKSDWEIRNREMEEYLEEHEDEWKQCVKQDDTTQALRFFPS